MKLLAIACAILLVAIVLSGCILIPVAALGIAKLAHVAYNAEHCEKAEDRCGAD
jgi:hypothetical protein